MSGEKQSATGTDLVESEPTLPWERQPNERAHHFKAFSIYRDLDPSTRSLQKCARIYYGEENYSISKLRTVEKWSKNFGWVARVTAWLDHLDEVSRQTELDAIEQMKRLQAFNGSRLQMVGALELEKLLKEVKTQRSRTLSIKDILSYLTDGAKLERLGRGEPESITEERGDSRYETEWTRVGQAIDATDYEEADEEDPEASSSS